MKPIVLLILFCIGVAWFIKRAHSNTLGCLDVIKRLYPYLLQGFDDLLADPNAIDDAVRSQMWTLTQGYKGLWRRWCNASGLVRLCQLHAIVDPVPDEAMRYVTERSFLLTWCTLRAAAWGLLRAFAPGRAAHNAFESVRLYAELAYRAHSFIEGDTAPLCASMLASIL